MKKKRLFLIPLCLLLLAAAWFLLRSRIPQRWYTADELGIPQLQSPLDADGDGIDERNSHDGQIKTRLEAFFEVLEAKRAEGAAQGGNANGESTAQGGTAETKGGAR